MFKVSRRDALCSLAGLAFASSTLRASNDNLRIGVTDWNLKLGADPKAVPLASQLGFDGVQISFGRKLVGGKMPVDNPE
ncbi:MAG: hypothetical protein JO033_09140, partial [Acidobacteriaceae bacterium]|nr:hypothetical protein [Acidobacteriaceae bacterium]